MASRIEAMVEAARQTISRVDAATAATLRDQGALFVDTRPIAQRAQYGTVPGALVVDRNVLEWRLDPTGDHQDPIAAAHVGPVVVFCQQGYSSSLAVKSLTDLGRADVHDLAGGFDAWASAGLPVEPPS